MKLKLITETIGINGTKDIARSEFDKRQVVIGRGAGVDIRIESRYLSLKHLALYDQGGTMIVEDLGSLSGVLVNNIPISRQALKDGDTVSFGDHTMVVQKSVSPFELVLTLQETEDTDLKSRINNDLFRFDTTRVLSKTAKISLIIALFMVAVFFIYPLTKDSKASWSPGALTSSHRVLEKNCSSCHEGNFKKVSDTKCLDCHQLSAHTSKETKESFRCVDCHSEHRGLHGLNIKSSSHCTTCHSSMEPAIGSFAKHPDFKAHQLTDQSHLKFSHHAHMVPDLATLSGTKTLQCAHCHELDDNREFILKINFEKNCHECHSLEFDEKLPGIEVPHGSEVAVYNTLLKYKNNLSRPLEEVEKTVFKTTTCNLCHEIKNSKNTPHRFEVEKLKLKTHWVDSMSRAHALHEAVECESCHAKSFTSESSEDILLPHIADCQNCHASGDLPGMVPTECSSCHGYHQSLKFDNLKPRLMKVHSF